MNKGFLVLLGIVFFAVSVQAGTCQQPDISIFIVGSNATQLTPTDYMVDPGMDFNMVCKYSFDPPGGTECPILSGPGNDSNYYGVWMYTALDTGDFNTLGKIPQFTPSWNDMNCSGQWCTTQGMPLEDRNQVRKITAIGDATYQVACGFREGKNPKPNQISQKIKIHVYPNGCKPPTNGSFDSNQTCVYHDNEIMVPQNYNIQSAGKHYLIDTNVRFYQDLNNSHKITVKNTFDFNGNGEWIVGLNGFEPGSFPIIPLLVLLFIFPFRYVFKHVNSWKEVRA